MPIYNKPIQLFSAYSANELVSVFERINEEVRFLDNCVSLDVLPVSKLIRQYNIQAKSILAIDEKDARLKKIANDCKQNIEEAITTLQIHDMISQKLDHIHIIHTGLTQDLISLEEELQIAKMTHLPVILELIIMNREQLLMIKKEYLEAVRTIHKKLMDTETMIKAVTSYSSQLPHFFFHYQQFEKIVDHVTLRLLQMANDINPHYSKAPTRERKLLTIAAIFTMESERHVLNQILYANNATYQVTTDLQNTPETDQIELF